MNENTVVVRHEWMDTVLDIIHFFLRHSSIEYDGAKQTARLSTMGRTDGRSRLTRPSTPALRRLSIWR